MDIKDVVTPISAASQEENDAAITYVRHLTALAAGCAAGALRLEALKGFGFYFATCISVTLLLIVMGGKPSKFFSSPVQALCFHTVLPALPGYVLAWSLVYSLVET